MLKKCTALLFAAALLLSATSALAAGSDLEGQFPAKNTYKGFADVSESASNWSFPYIKTCYEVGLMEGTDKGFAPNATMQVSEVAAIAGRIGEILSGKPIPNTDVGGLLPWYTDAVAYMNTLAAAAKKDNPLTARLAQPTQSATREDFFYLLALVVPEKLLTPINKITEVPDTADETVLQFYNAGILTGLDEYGSFRGWQGLTRMEAAAMVGRIVEPKLRQVFTPEKPAWDVSLQTLGVSGDIPFIVADTEYIITAQQYLHILGVSRQMLEAAAKEAGLAFHWGLFVGDTPVLERMEQDALDTSFACYSIEKQCREKDITLTPAEEKGIDAQMDAQRKGYDSEQAYRKALFAQGMSPESCRWFYTCSALQVRLEMDYIAQSHVLRAKHILVEDKALADSLMAQLKADPSEKNFDRLMNANSTDGGLATNPDGYTFLPNVMVPEFEAGVRALEIGKIGGPVKSEFGYHIILRLDPLNTVWPLLAQELDKTLVTLPAEKCEPLLHFNIQEFFSRLEVLASR